MYQESHMLCFGFPLIFRVGNYFPFWDWDLFSVLFVCNSKLDLHIFFIYYTIYYLKKKNLNCRNQKNTITGSDTTFTPGTDNGA